MQGHNHIPQALYLLFVGAVVQNATLILEMGIMRRGSADGGEFQFTCRVVAVPIRKAMSREGDGGGMRCSDR